MVGFAYAHFLNDGVHVSASCSGLEETVIY
jgi:hypothetical protein